MTYVKCENERFLTFSGLNVEQGSGLPSFSKRFAYELSKCK